MAQRVTNLFVVGSKYPWSEWMDGSAWCVTQGEDFDVEPSVFRSYLYEVARKNGTSVITRSDGPQVLFQFTNKKELG